MELGESRWPGLLAIYLTDNSVSWFMTMHLRVIRLYVGFHKVQSLDLYFFLLYINDLFHVSNLLSSILFADDTNIFSRHNDLATLVTILNVQLALFSSWFNANKFTVHPDRSKFIIFHPRRKQINLSDINISINNSPILLKHFLLLH